MSYGKASIEHSDMSESDKLSLARELKKQASETPDLFKSLPDNVRDPANYEKIKKAIIDTTRQCKKNHSEIGEFSQCKTCSIAMIERRVLLEKFGFTSPAQYKAWDETQQQIIKLRQKHPEIDGRLNKS